MPRYPKPKLTHPGRIPSIIPTGRIIQLYKKKAYHAALVGVYSVVLTTFSGCQCPGIAGHKLVTKTVLVRAVESGNGQIIKAVPAFYKTGREFCIPDSADRCLQPLVWHTERMRDGALRITRTTWKNANEGLYLTEAGFYAVEVPKLAILIFSRQRTWSEQLKPVTVRMDGSTAYLPRWDRTSYQDSEEGLERKIQIK